MSIEYLDGIRLYRVLSAGLLRVLEREDYLNKINVFPVPDADTGTNMAYTLSVIKNDIQQNVHSNIANMSDLIADSALDGARGNAGSILAQFLVGLAEGLQNHTKVTTQQFAEAVKTGKQYAYQALLNPVEGTILTVISDWSDALQRFSNKYSDFVETLARALKIAQKSVKETPKKLKVLAKAGVVDAGGQGFVDLLQGIQEFISEGKISNIGISLPKIFKKSTIKEISFNEKYRYCTECIISGENINRIKLKDQLMMLGDSLIIAGSKHKAKVHIHTDKPKTVFEICQSFGQMSKDKADDMLQQQKDAHRQNKRIALVVDSTADLPDSILEERNIHVVPVRLNFGDKHYIDKVTLTSEKFWDELQNNPVHPKTSQPSPFRRQYQFLATHYESAISIHLPAETSGTMQSALTASKTLTNFPTTVIDSNSLSIGIGLTAIRAAEAIDANKTHDEIINDINNAIKNTKIYILLYTLDYIVRGGRISKSKKTIADLLHAHPILSLDDTGKIVTDGKIFGKRNLYDRFIKYVEKKVPHNSQYRIGIVHGNCEQRARKFEQHFINKIGKKNVFFSQIGPGLGTHAGTNAMGIAVQIQDN
ncbi:MAG: DegV family EDD domain-containing protein [Planctomycetia bacterium]|nr:DegV family EDD domain-containing protein [Planctomycetia bacterium]